MDTKPKRDTRYVPTRGFDKQLCLQKINERLEELTESLSIDEFLPDAYFTPQAAQYKCAEESFKIMEARAKEYEASCSSPFPSAEVWLANPQKVLEYWAGQDKLAAANRNMLQVLEDSKRKVKNLKKRALLGCVIYTELTNDKKYCPRYEQIKQKLDPTTVYLMSLNALALARLDPSAGKIVPEIGKIFPRSEPRCKTKTGFKLNWDAMLLNSVQDPCKRSKNISSLLREILKNERIMNKKCDIVPFEADSHTLCPTYRTGSIYDGCSTARWFSNAPLWVVESDVMYGVGTWPEEAAFDFQEYPGHKAYCLIKASGHHTAFLLSIVQAMELETNDGFLDPSKLRNCSLQLFTRLLPETYSFAEKKTQFQQGYKFALNNLMFQPEMYNRMQKLSPLKLGRDHLASTIACRSPNYGGIETPIDLVPCIKLDFWPDISKGWLTRKGKWPTEEQKKVIMDLGCHVVPKASEQVKEKGWRYSYSMPEHELMQMFSEGQLMTYYVFKAMFYKYIRPIGASTNGDEEIRPLLTSYLCKTTMLWVCEDCPPTDQLWSDDYRFVSIDALLMQLERFLCRRFLPHFFIKDCNLIQDIPVVVLKEAVMKLRQIRQDIEFYIPFNLQEIITVLKDPGFVQQVWALKHQTLDHIYAGTENVFSNPKESYSLREQGDSPLKASDNVRLPRNLNVHRVNFHKKSGSFHEPKMFTKVYCHPNAKPPETGKVLQEVIDDSNAGLFNDTVLCYSRACPRSSQLAKYNLSVASDSPVLCYSK